MRIIRDDREHAYTKTCENCGREASGREIEAVGYSGEGRGWFFVCFGCFAPRITWKPRGRHAKTYTTPVDPPARQDLFAGQPDLSGFLF
jgi:hypothetical protein